MMVEAKWSGEYPTLCFGEWTLNVDGKDVSLSIPEWIEENNYWLCAITNNMELKREIFRTIQEADFRRGECGGCV